MDECNAALVLMSLSCSPLSPRQYATTRLASSPGGSSASSWCSGSSSPPLSDEGAPQMNTSSQSPNRVRTTSLSTSDEGIGMDYNEDTPRKRRVSFFCFVKFCFSIKLSPHLICVRFSTQLYFVMTKIFFSECQIIKCLRS